MIALTLSGLIDILAVTIFFGGSLVFFILLLWTIFRPRGED